MSARQEKQATALSLLGSLNDGVQLWQVAWEFLAASRKLESFGIAQAQVRQRNRSTPPQVDAFPVRLGNA